MDLKGREGRGRKEERGEWLRRAARREEREGERRRGENLVSQYKVVGRIGSQGDVDKHLVIVHRSVCHLLQKRGGGGKGEKEKEG